MNCSPLSDPYYECSMPLVVSNFNLPNSNVNKDGPYLQITEQPQSKFRFRYQSEMVGTHGQLKAESSTKNRTVYPNIKLCNWNGDSALIKLMLYTAEDNVNERKKHVHQLHGKNCDKEGFRGGCEIVVEAKNDYTAQFPNLGIIHIAKRDVSNIISNRKKDELVNFARIKNPSLRNESIQHNISPMDLKKIKDEADEEAKNMDLNKVVLRFQAFFYDQKRACYTPITDYVDSCVIFNLKNASTGELKIVRMSTASASCSGGTEVWMLVEKVKKNNVKVKFFELDQDGNEVWRSYGEFKDSDVHHQYAIVFKTPIYRFTNIRDPVNVKVQLERTTDHDTSEPYDFTFIPETLKRNNILMDPAYEPEYHSQKRARASSMEMPMDLKMSEHQESLFRGQTKAEQSPPQMVPSAINPESPASQVGGLYSPERHNEYNYNPTIVVSTIDEELIKPKVQGNNYAGNYNDGQSNFMTNTSNMFYMSPGQVSPPSFCHQVAAENFDQSQLLKNPCISPAAYHQVPSPSMYQTSEGVPSPSHSINSYYQPSPNAYHTTETASQQINQFDIFFNSKTQEPSQFGFSDLLNSPTSQSANEPDLLSLLNNDNLYATNNRTDIIQRDSAGRKGANPPKMVVKITTESPDVISTLTEKMSNIKVIDDKNKESNQSQQKVDSNFNVILKAAEQLSKYYTNPKDNLLDLIETHEYILTSHSTNGDSSIHKAILTRNFEDFQLISGALKKMKNLTTFTSQNQYGETPLHLAVKMNELQMLEDLMKTPMMNPLQAIDEEGFTVLHTAANLQNAFLKSILSNPINGFNQTIKKAINLINYQGETALHIAARCGNLQNVACLLDSGASVHLCERKQGANPLHLSVMNGQHEIAKYLIEKTNVTVDAGLLNRDTCLHLAAQAKDQEMCLILIAGKANPYARNNVKRVLRDSEDTAEDDDSSDEESQDEDYCTPIDYAEGDRKLLEILQENFV